jgi:beta-mannosidase
MKIRHDLSSLSWQLTGCTPYLWMLSDLEQISHNPAMEAPAIPARVPGSVQSALLTAGLLPDWTRGLDARGCEWVENRHWIFETILPDDWLSQDWFTRLTCLGLDDRGWIYLNGKEVGRFNGAHLPYTFDLSHLLRPTHNNLQIIFDVPPRWLGQFGYTSTMTDWKPRFYYTWDWVSRLVQIGVWDQLSLETSDGAEISGIDLNTHYDPITQLGQVRVTCQATGGSGSVLALTLSEGDEIMARKRFLLEVHSPSKAATLGVTWDGLPVKAWWPNGMGSQKLYTLSCQLLSAEGAILDLLEQRVGFKSIEWRPCSGAPDGADPWLCTANQQPFFLQGVNWTPIRPNFADLRDEDYRLRLTLYRDLGINVLRVWGGATLEKSIFYNLCDELGLLVWQEFPLSSSGVENWPPEDETSLVELTRIAISYLQRRKHHACLLMWGGGNELQGNLEGGKTGIGRPVDLSHPLVARFAEIVSTRDPEHRFVATSSTGPRFNATREDFGKGLHWDVHGPWKADPDLEVWKSYWEDVDALFHSEVGAPGASPVDVILETCGELPALPVDETNPVWRRTAWWIEAALYTQEKGHPPATLEEYVAWSQERQAQALTIVASALKRKFPRVGGVIFWMGHDCFPCTANTSIVDYYGRPKPAALALKEIFTTSQRR